MPNGTLPETKHTPGPWRFEAGVEDNAGEFYVCHAGTVCDCTTVCNPRTEADARLIARAPDLLAENERLREALDRVKAAIARRSEPVMDPPYTAAFNAALDMVGAALSEQEGK